jgi:glutathione S-transferase
VLIDSSRVPSCRRRHGAARVAAVLLYNSAVSGNCYKVRLVCAQLGIPYEAVELDVVDRSNRPQVLGGLNPALRVPTVVLDDGRPLAESSAIVWYLAEGTPLVPDDPYERAQVLQWMFYEQYLLEPTVAVVRFWVAFSGRADEFVDQIPAKMKGGYAALAGLERGLDGHDYLVGGRYTLADIALYAYTHVAHEGGFDLSGYPAINGWLGRVAAQPGHVPIDA